MGLINKGFRWIVQQFRARGVISSLALNKLQFFGLLRALLLKLFYFQKLESSIFFIQANSTVELLSRQARMKIGKFAFIRKNASIRIDHNGELQLGDYVFINDNCNINCVSEMKIGAYTKIAPNVCINDHDHNYREAGGERLLVGNVTIGAHVWIGSNVVILRNTTIGDHAVIAAGSVVKGNVPAGTLYIDKRESRCIEIDRNLGVKVEGSA